MYWQRQLVCVYVWLYVMYEWAFMYRLNNNQDFGVNDDDDDSNEITMSIIIIMIQ